MSVVTLCICVIGHSENLYNSAMCGIDLGKGMMWLYRMNCLHSPTALIGISKGKTTQFTSFYDPV